MLTRFILKNSIQNSIRKNRILRLCFFIIILVKKMKSSTAISPTKPPLEPVYTVIPIERTTPKIARIRFVIGSDFFIKRKNRGDKETKKYARSFGSYIVLENNLPSTTAPLSKQFTAYNRVEIQITNNVFLSFFVESTLIRKRKKKSMFDKYFKKVKLKATLV